jgi:thiamine kinase-like enzyme
MEELRAAYQTLSFHLPKVVLHGDASVGNVLVDTAHTARLIDLDGVCFGHCEWDLILTAIYHDRYRWHTQAEYTEFCSTYEYDIRQWDGYTTLGDVREFLMVTWMTQNGDVGSNRRAELSKRILALRTGAPRSDWQPY